jgi:hypothetical protein
MGDLLLYFAAVLGVGGPVLGRETASDLRGAEGIRTPDPLHAMEVRYQLRHSPASPPGRQVITCPPVRAERV